MKKIYTKIFLIIFCLFFAQNTFAVLTCAITASCVGAGEVKMMNLSGSDNAHGELSSQSNYTTYLCCSGVSGLGNNCSGNYAVIGTLSANTNGTFEENTETNYSSANDVCISNSLATPTVGYSNTNCSSFDDELMTMDPVTTNAHLGPSYTRKICATVPAVASITFDLDTATTDTNSSAPYTVALGTLTTGTVARSNGSINSIWVDLDTSASGGAVVTVLSANAALLSTSVPADTISSATATMAAGTENYGLCIASVTQTSGGPLAKVAPFDGVTCIDGASNTVGKVDTSSASILNTTSATITGGRAQIRVNGAISGVTDAHNDYTDTLTFIATGTF